MLKARMQGRECEVRVITDVSDNYAVEIAPILASPRKDERYKSTPAPIVVKLHADNKDAAAKAALEMLKAAKKIDDFSL